MPLIRSRLRQAAAPHWPAPRSRVDDEGQGRGGSCATEPALASRTLESLATVRHNQARSIALSSIVRMIAFTVAQSSNRQWLRPLGAWPSGIISESPADADFCPVDSDSGRYQACARAPAEAPRSPRGQTRAVFFYARGSDEIGWAVRDQRNRDFGLSGEPLAPKHEKNKPIDGYNRNLPNGLGVRSPRIALAVTSACSKLTVPSSSLW